MKAGELKVVEFCGEQGSFRVSPLQRSVDLARMESFTKGPNTAYKWAIVGYAATDGKAREIQEKLKVQAKENFKRGEANG